MPDGQQSQLHIAVNTQLVKDAVAVAVNGLRTDAEGISNFLCLLAVGNEDGGLQFTLGESLKR